ncbi:MAG: hypothetical protein JOZ47_00900 [Kutzneria sp.]|nr:hypothetical protein [Kutzneria sp.]
MQQHHHVRGHSTAGPSVPSLQAPPVRPSADPASRPVAPALRRVITLLFVNLGLSVVLTVLVFLFRDSVVDYQLAHMATAPGTNLADLRSTLRQQVWFRTGGIVLVTAVYLYIGYRLRRGHRGAYRRVISISLAGMIGLGAMVVTSQYPGWMRAEQVLQMAVLAALLWSVTRPELRTRFARKGSGR